VAVFGRLFKDLRPIPRVLVSGSHWGHVFLGGRVRYDGIVWHRRGSASVIGAGHPRPVGNSGSGMHWVGQNLFHGSHIKIASTFEPRGLVR
jgi:hypothetical protein